MSIALPVLVGSLAAGLVAWLAFERLQHRRALRAIRTRIHINGTRGKSSVTRLVASGLRAGGHRVLAKTTGTLARVILPNERELPIYRPIGANVREQVRIVRLAAATKADVLVIECMALQPPLQWLSEKMFVRATHGVITNARPDHLDVMGPGDEDVARALAGMMPRGGACYTAERTHRGTFEMAAEDRRCSLVAIDADDVAAVSDDDMRAFRWYEHSENVALALRICEDLGVDRETALGGMTKGTPDPGALTFHHVDFFGRKLIFANAFAANDPVSSEQIWNLCRTRFPDARTVAVFNCRSDRADRSRQLGACLADWTPPDKVVCVGTGTLFFARSAGELDLVNLEGDDARECFERIVELCGDETLIVGLGNIGGIGLELVRLFRNRAQEPRD